MILEPYWKFEKKSCISAVGKEYLKSQCESYGMGSLVVILREVEDQTREASSAWIGRSGDISK
jgi:hypothetical protein